MTQTRNVLGLDVGDRRIGVALASLEACLPSPLLTIDRTKVADIFEEIKRLVELQSVQIVVAGLPRDMEGRETAQTKTTREFIEALEQVLHTSIHLQDEAGTSLEAKAELEAKNKKYEKGDVDKLAATYILRDWLNANAEKIL